MNESISYIQHLDLGYLVSRLVTQHKWKKDEAVEAVRRYKNFLILVCKYPGIISIPAYDMDHVWHEHILHTQKYMQDCNKIFGKYLHHCPATEIKEGNSFLEKAAINFASFYIQEFGESYSCVLDVNSFW